MRWRRGWIVAAVAAWICGDAAYAVTIQASGEGEPQQAIHYGLDESGRRWRVDDHGDPQAVAWNPDFGPWQKALELGLDDDSDSDSDGSLELVEFTLAERVVIEGTDWVDWHEIITTDGVSWKLEAPEILVDGEAASVTPIGGGGDFEFFFDDHGRRLDLFFDPLSEGTELEIAKGILIPCSADSDSDCNDFDSDLDSDSAGFLVDEVRVLQYPTVPEPRSALLILVGMAGLAFGGRRRGRARRRAGA